MPWGRHQPQGPPQPDADTWAAAPVPQGIYATQPGQPEYPVTFQKNTAPGLHASTINVGDIDVWAVFPMKPPKRLQGITPDSTPSQAPGLNRGQNR